MLVANSPRTLPSKSTPI